MNAAELAKLESEKARRERAANAANVKHGNKPKSCLLADVTSKQEKPKRERNPIVRTAAAKAAGARRAPIG